MEVLPTLVQLVVLACFGALAPIAMMRMLAPRLARSAPRVRNYRGREVFTGLGIVWVIWMALVLLGGFVLEALLGWEPSWLGTLLKAAPLVFGACALGMFDDVAGRRDRAKGFRGHLAALRRGEITTGMLKLIGIGVLSVVVGAQISGEPSWSLGYVGGLVVRAAVMALCANEINLFDLRPARALKVYSGLLLLSCAVLALLAASPAGVAAIGAVAALSLVPVVAVWPYDAREQGLMGDAGSNAMGAYLGFVMAVTMPLPALAGVAVVLLAGNLASERVSYSALIERVALLSWLDGLGRPCGDCGLGRSGEPAAWFGGATGLEDMTEREGAAGLDDAGRQTAVAEPEGDGTAGGSEGGKAAGTVRADEVPRLPGPFGSEREICELAAEHARTRVDAIQSCR